MSTNRSTIPEPFRTPPAAEKPKGILDFIEHPLTLTALFALGGLVGTLIYTPFYVLCAICLLFGLHRSGYVSARAVRVQVRIYVIAAVVLCVGGYFLYGLLDAAVQRVQDDFAKKVADLVREKPSKLPETTDVLKKEPPVETRPSELPKPPKPKVTPTQNPLEIIAFNSSQDISIANNGPVSVYAIRLLVNEGQWSKSFGLGFEIEPGKTHTVWIGDGFKNVRTLRNLAGTWKEHLSRTKTQFSNCWQFTFFSQSDARLLQIRDHYLGEGEGFIYDKDSGTIYYKVDGFPGNKEQKVPIAVTVTLNQDVCPSS